MLEIRCNIVDGKELIVMLVRQDATRNVVLGRDTFVFVVVLDRYFGHNVMIGIAVNYKIICKILIASWHNTQINSTEIKFCNLLLKNK